MHLSELLVELRQVNVTAVGTWQTNNRMGITLSDPSKYFPNLLGPQYPLDLTDGDLDPILDAEEVQAIKRRFGIGEA